MTDVMTRYQMADSDGTLLLAGDWVFVPPDLVSDDGLETAVVLSLFTDGLAREDDVLPYIVGDDRRGWWADTDAPEGPLGSRLWLLAREKTTETVRQRAEFYCREALQWLVADDVADRIEVSADWGAAAGQLNVEVGIYRDARLVFSKPFAIEWRATVRAV